MFAGAEKTATTLCAELILTKPVSKDQARTTIRTAVGRVRKDSPAAEAAAGLASERVSDDHIASMVGAAAMSAGVAKEDSAASHKVDVSPQLTSFAEPAPSFVPASAGPSTSSNVAALAAGFAAKRSATGPSADPMSAKKINDAVPSLSRPSLSHVPSLSPTAAANSVHPVAASPKPALVMKPSDDPVLAELERAEQQEKEKEKEKENDAPPSVRAQKPAPAQAATEVHAHRPPRQPKSQGALVAAMVLVLAGGAFYAAWTYQPAFRAMAQPHVDRLLGLVGNALPPVEPARPAKVPATPATQNTLPESGSAADANQASPTVPAGVDSTIVPAIPAAGASAGASNPVALGTPEVSPERDKQSLATQLQKNKAADSKLEAKPGQSEKSEKSEKSKKDDQADVDGQPANDSNAIILSSQGAQKRLVRSVQPKYPANARSGDAQGTIVLKTVVGPDGKVTNVRLVEGNASLSRAAMDAVRQWRYRPYVRNGKAQAFQTVVIVDFQRP
jgi:TonB family protein